MGPQSRVFSYSNDGRIQYIQAQNGLTVGEKRNLALTMAKGELIAHFDDDDLCAPPPHPPLPSLSLRSCTNWIVLG
jgi:hypothetical protein